MFYRTRGSTRLLFRLVGACCVALLYIQIQLLPDAKRNQFVRVLRFEYDKKPPESVQWSEVCKPNRSAQHLIAYLSKFPLENTTKRLNIFRWDDVKGYSINSLIRQPWFPRQPSTISFASSALVRHNSLHYGQWIVGYVHAHVTGEYKFALSSDDSSELWISEDESSENSRRVAMVGDGYESGWTRLGQHTKYLNQISNPMLLKKCKKYFIEILHKQSLGESFVSLSWKLPGYEKFFVITGAYLSPFLSEVPAGMKPLHVIFSEGEEFEKLRKAIYRQRLNKLSLETSAKYMSSRVRRLEFGEEKRSTTDCQPGVYKSSTGRQGSEGNIAAVHPLLQTYKTNAAKNTNDDKMLRMLQHNLGVLPQKTAKTIVAQYLALVEDFHPGKYSLSSIIAVESKQFSSLNERYLLDLVLRQHDSEADVRVSEYVYKQWADETICTVQELKWSSTTFIQIIVFIAKDDGKWALHLIDNIEEILEKTDDKNVHVTLLDYEEDYFDLNKVLSESSIANFNLIRTSGDLNKIQDIQEAMNSQPSRDRIVMVIDPHVKLPLDIMDQTRKHCVDDYMSFSPLAFHLNEGYSPAEPEGWWDYRGLKVLAMFSNDWDKCSSNAGTEQSDEDLENQIQSRIDLVRIKMDDLYYLTEIPYTKT